MPLFHKRLWNVIPAGLVAEFYEWRKEGLAMKEARNCWGLAVGLAQTDMKWYYTWDEVKARLDRKLKQ